MAESDEIGTERDFGQGRFRSRAYLTILSKDVPPLELAERLGVEPDEMWQRGDPSGRHGSEGQPFNGVVYRAALDEKRTPTDQLRALVERLRPHTAQIAALTTDPATHSAQIRVTEHTARDNVDLGADPEVTRAAAEMGAVLIFDVYFYSQDD